MRKPPDHLIERLLPSTDTKWRPPKGRNGPRTTKIAHPRNFVNTRFTIFGLSTPTPGVAGGPARGAREARPTQRGAEPPRMGHALPGSPQRGRPGRGGRPGRTPQPPQQPRRGSHKRSGRSTRAQKAPGAKAKKAARKGGKGPGGGADRPRSRKAGGQGGTRRPPRGHKPTRSKARATDQEARSGADGEARTSGGSGGHGARSNARAHTADATKPGGMAEGRARRSEATGRNGRTGPAKRAAGERARAGEGSKRSAAARQHARCAKSPAEQPPGRSGPPGSEHNRFQSGMGCPRGEKAEAEPRPAEWGKGPGPPPSYERSGSRGSAFVRGGVVIRRSFRVWCVV